MGGGWRLRYVVYYNKDGKETYDAFEHEFSAQLNDGDLSFYHFGVLRRGYAKGTWTRVEVE